MMLVDPLQSFELEFDFWIRRIRDLNAFLYSFRHIE